MAKKQTRRSISVRGVTYNRLRLYCEGAGVSMSDFVEQRIADYLAGVPQSAMPTVATHPAQAPRLPAVVAAAAARPRLVEKPVVAPVAAVVPARPAAPPLRASERSTFNRMPDKAPRVAPRLPPVLAVPAASSIIKKPMPVAALRSSAPGPAPDSAVANGRPAPTPAKEVIKDRYSGPANDGKDYRVIRF